MGTADSERHFAEVRKGSLTLASHQDPNETED